MLFYYPFVSELIGGLASLVSHAESSKNRISSINLCTSAKNTKGFSREYLSDFMTRESSEFLSDDSGH